MAQPKFYLQPLAAAICIECYSPLCFANVDASADAMPVKESIRRAHGLP